MTEVEEINYQVANITALEFESDYMENLDEDGAYAQNADHSMKLSYDSGVCSFNSIPYIAAVDKGPQSMTKYSLTVQCIYDRDIRIGLWSEINDSPPRGAYFLLSSTLSTCNFSGFTSRNLIVNWNQSKKCIFTIELGIIRPSPSTSILQASYYINNVHKVSIGRHYQANEWKNFGPRITLNDASGYADLYYVGLGVI